MTRWDLHVRGGLLGGLKARGMIEEHGGGKQLFRLRVWPSVSPVASGAVAGLILLGALAAADGAPVGAVLLMAAGLGLALAVYASCAAAMRAWVGALAHYAVSQSLIATGR